MSDNKKYYYIRLKDNFFDSDEIKMLESVPNDGYKFSNILLKMYLKSLKYNGRLMFNERIPFNAEMLATVTNHSVGDINRAIDMFKKFGLIEVLESGEIYMLDIQSYIGQASTEADRIKEYRRKISNERNKSVQMYNKRTPEIEIEIEKELDIDKNIDAKEKQKNSISNDFEEIWSLYPKKSGKDVAKKKYINAIKEGVSNNLIKNKIEEYKKQIKNSGTDKKYIKNGSTWFNQKGWEDEYDIGYVNNSSDVDKDVVSIQRKRQQQYEVVKNHYSKIFGYDVVPELIRDMPNFDNDKAWDLLVSGNKEALIRLKGIVDKNV